jgi:hypothetical protein
MSVVRRVAHGARLALLLPLLVVGCRCQRTENVEAKARMKQASPPSAAEVAAKETLSAAAVTAGPVMERLARMSGEEIFLRLGSFQFAGNAEMSFGRGDQPALRASEKTTMTQAGRGDFRIETISGDDTEMRLVYLNEIFFLKNNNGRWRVSRDPGGEREDYRSDALNVWRAFYDLVGHALIVERSAATTTDGRPAVGYRLSLRDDSAKATNVQPLPEEAVATDATGTAAEAQNQTRLSARVRRWRERAHAKSGAGTMVVDEKTGVILSVNFEGDVVVGDGPEPAKLHVKIDQKFTGIGAAYTIDHPPDAIDEITRTKWPAHPRAPFEEDGVVAPLPDAGPSAQPTRKPSAAPVDEDDG